MSLVKIEAAGTDPAFPGSKLWDVTAATVTTSANGRKYTKEELEHAAFTLSYRPLNINHNDQFLHFRTLAYPENSTLLAGWDKLENVVKTRIRVVDQQANAQLEKKEINHVSVEQVSNEMCADSMCNSKLQYGMAYTGMALVTHDVTPGDSKTEIKKIETVPFSQLIKVEGCSCGKKAEATIEQVKAAVTEQMEQELKAEYDLLVALSAKLALNPLDERLWEEYQSSKWSLQYKLTDLLRLEKGEAVAAKFLRKDELAIMKKAAEKLGQKA